MAAKLLRELLLVYSTADLVDGVSPEGAVEIMEAIRCALVELEEA